MNPRRLLWSSLTQNPSFLPRCNPEVMYFALGQVASSGLHSLFDRKTDTAIDFPAQTSMKRSERDPNLLEITIPVPGNTGSPHAGLLHQNAGASHLRPV